MVEISRYHDVAVLLVNNPPVNALSPGVPQAIEAALGHANGDASVRAIVLAGAGRTFMAGADIREFQKNEPLPYIEHLCHCACAVEDSAKPVVMAIHGTAFGAGLETALAGHYRVMAAGAQVGQPEVKLGLIPGAGGTQRLPRLIGMEKALEMCAFGEPVSAQDALACGLTDEIIPGDLPAGTVEFARALPAALSKTRSLRIAPFRDALFAEVREKVRAAMPGQLAPLLAMEALEAASRFSFGLSFEDGMKYERELFLRCWRSTQSRALLYLFFAQRAAAKQGAAFDETKARVGERLARCYQAELQALAMTPEEMQGALYGDANEPAVARVVRALGEEGARIVEEGLVPRASDIDVIWTSGYGFPAWRGGPMFTG